MTLRIIPREMGAGAIQEDEAVHLISDCLTVQ